MTPESARVQGWLAAAVTAAFVLAVAALLVIPAPPANREAVNLALGSLMTAFAGVVSYYFGSSRGSAVKDETITALAATRPAAGADRAES